MLKVVETPRKVVFTQWVNACDYVYKCVKEGKIDAHFETELEKVPVLEIAEYLTDFLNSHITVHPLKYGEYYSVKI